MQSQRIGIEDDDDVKLSLTYIKKFQNNAEVRILVSNETVSSTKGVVRRKKINVSIRKVIYIIN